jgi:outer membrane protein OmpA-like peptidoglycan-associated protein
MNNMLNKHFSQIFGAALCALLLSISLTATAQNSGGIETRKISPKPRDEVKVDVWFDKQCGASYKQQEKIIINFRTNVDSYLTVYDIDTRGQVSVLFPNSNQPDNFVRGGQTYSIPNASYTYDLVVEGPEGIEYVDAVSSTDSYYHWNFNQGEPRWVREWGLSGRNYNNLQARNYQSSSEYKNRPRALGSEGEQSVARNSTISRQLREDIRSRIIVQPRVSEQPREQQPVSISYGTGSCYFYVLASQAYSQPQPQYPSPEEYLREQQREFEQIPGFDARRAEGRLIVTVPNTVLFDFDSYALRYEARRDLDRVADILARYPETNITVAGHTDSIGDANYNQRLSEYRAQSVANYLLSRGVQPFRIGSVGYGETMPIASNSTEGGRQRNRRVELDIRVSY